MADWDDIYNDYYPTGTRLDENAPDTACERCAKGWPCVVALEQRITDLEVDLRAAVAALVAVRAQADRSIGGEPYLVSPGGFYTIDAVLSRPGVAALRDESPTA